MLPEVCRLTLREQACAVQSSRQNTHSEVQRDRVPNHRSESRWADLAVFRRKETRWHALGSQQLSSRDFGTSRAHPQTCKTKLQTRTGRTLDPWVLESSLARICGLHDMALELVCPAEFWCNRHCKTSPVDLEGYYGQVKPKIGRKPTQQFPARLLSSTLQTGPW